MKFDVWEKSVLKEKSLHKAPECIQSMDIFTGLFYIKSWSYEVLCVDQGYPYGGGEVIPA